MQCAPTKRQFLAETAPISARGVSKPLEEEGGGGKGGGKVESTSFDSGDLVGFLVLYLTKCNVLGNLTIYFDEYNAE